MKVLIWKYVLKKLMKIEMFTGKYDTTHGSAEFMAGIETVMEFIATKAQCEDEMLSIWYENVKASLSRASKDDCSYGERR